MFLKLDSTRVQLIHRCFKTLGAPGDLLTTNHCFSLKLNLSVGSIFEDSKQFYPVRQGARRTTPELGSTHSLHIVAHQQEKQELAKLEKQNMFLN